MYRKNWYYSRRSKLSLQRRINKPSLATWHVNKSYKIFSPVCWTVSVRPWPSGYEDIKRYKHAQTLLTQGKYEDRKMYRTNVHVSAENAGCCMNPHQPLILTTVCVRFKYTNVTEDNYCVSLRTINYQQRCSKRVSQRITLECKYFRFFTFKQHYIFKCTDTQQFSPNSPPQKKHLWYRQTMFTVSCVLRCRRSCRNCLHIAKILKSGATRVCFSEGNRR